MPNKANSHITLAVHTNNEALIYTKKSKKKKLRQTLRLVVGCATESVVSILKYIGLRFGAGILLSVNLCVISQLFVWTPFFRSTKHWNVTNTCFYFTIDLIFAYYHISRNQQTNPIYIDLHLKWIDKSPDLIGCLVLLHINSICGHFINVLIKPFRKCLNKMCRFNCFEFNISQQTSK